MLISPLIQLVREMDENFKRNSVRLCRRAPELSRHLPRNAGERMRGAVVALCVCGRLINRGLYAWIWVETHQELHRVEKRRSQSQGTQQHELPMSESHLQLLPDGRARGLRRINRFWGNGADCVEVDVIIIIIPASIIGMGSA